MSSGFLLLTSVGTLVSENYQHTCGQGCPLSCRCLNIYVTFSFLMLEVAIVNYTFIRCGNSVFLTHCRQILLFKKLKMNYQKIEIKRQALRFSFYVLDSTHRNLSNCCKVSKCLLLISGLPCCEQVTACSLAPVCKLLFEWQQSFLNLNV